MYAILEADTHETSPSRDSRHRRSPNFGTIVQSGKIARGKYLVKIANSVPPRELRNIHLVLPMGPKVRDVPGDNFEDGIGAARRTLDNLTTEERPTHRSLTRSLTRSYIAEEKDPSACKPQCRTA